MDPLLLAAQRMREREQQAEQATQDRTDPPGWVARRLGEHVWSKQSEVMHAVLEHRRVAVHSCHGVGKSHIASRVVAWWLDVHEPGDAFVVTTAPTFPQVRAILWRYIRQAHRAGLLPGRVNQTEWLIDDELVAFGRKPADHDEAGFQGIHARRVLVVLDEASGIPDQLWLAADALTTNDGCRILAIGNPDSNSSQFARVCAPTSRWHRIGISAFDSPNFTGEQVPVKLGEQLISPAWAAEKKLDWGEDNPIYRSKVLGQFSVDDPGKVVRGSHVAACRLPPDTAPTAAELLPVELGVDVGGGGDETVIRERRGRVAGREWRELSEDPATIAPMVVRAIVESGATRVKIDEIGVGRGLIGELRNRRDVSARIVPVNVAARAREPSKFSNVRAEMWWEVGRELSRLGGWDLSVMENADTTVAQLLQPGWDTAPAGGAIRIESKDEIRKRLKRSPDNADALLLAYYEPPSPRVRFM
jgi:hypothetical protein